MDALFIGLPVCHSAARRRLRTVQAPLGAQILRYSAASPTHICVYAHILTRILGRLPMPETSPAASFRELSNCPGLAESVLRLPVITTQPANSRWEGLDGAHRLR